MIIRAESGGFRIPAGNRLNDLTVLHRHVFVTGKIIVIDIAETQRQLLYDLTELDQRLVAAAVYDQQMKPLVAPDDFLSLF